MTKPDCRVCGGVGQSDSFAEDSVHDDPTCTACQGTGKDTSAPLPKTTGCTRTKPGGISSTTTWCAGTTCRWCARERGPGGYVQEDHDRRMAERRMEALGITEQDIAESMPEAPPADITNINHD